MYEACRDLGYSTSTNFDDLLNGKIAIVAEDINEESGISRDVVRRETWRMHLRIGADLALFAAGTAFILSEGTATYYYRMRTATRAGRGAARFVQESFCVEGADDPKIKTIDELILVNWPAPIGTSPSGLPWSITMITDPEARAAAVNAYWTV